jgi:hypothetical protein
MGGVAVDLVAGGATRWQVHGLRWQERVVGVGQGLVAGQFQHEAVRGLEGVGESACLKALAKG